MKKVIALIIAGVFLLAGCASIVKEDTRPTEYASDLSQVYQQVDLTPGIEKTPALYFLNADGTTLVAETRSITIEQNTRPERQVVEELLKGPEDENLKPVAAGFAFDSIETMYNVVNVNLKTSQPKGEDEIFTLCLALANTLSEFLNVNYVNVYVNGRAAGYQDEPVGALTKNQGILTDEIAKQAQHATTAEIATVLYFLDDSEKYLVPEVRSLQYEGGNYVSNIIEELANGPEEMYFYRQSVDSSIRVMGEPVIEPGADGKNVLVVDLNKSPVVFTQGFEDGETLAIASIVYTLLGFFPNVDQIRFTVNGVAVSDKVYMKNEFKSFIGATVRLYFPNADSTKLMAVDRTISQGIASFPSTIVSELISGPAETDSSDLWPVFPQGVTPGDVKDVYIANDIVVVDFASGILDKLKDMSSEDEMLMLYSIINSLTYLTDIRMVQFMVKGQRTQRISNTIDVRDPMMKNPGIIKY
jgi:spore germination protein GerM